MIADCRNTPNKVKAGEQEEEKSASLLGDNITLKHQRSTASSRRETIDQEPAAVDRISKSRPNILPVLSVKERSDHSGPFWI